MLFFLLLAMAATAAPAQSNPKVLFRQDFETDTPDWSVIELKRPGASQRPRFNLPIYPPAKMEVFHVELRLADFQGQGAFDPAMLRSILLIDGTAAGGGDLGKNTIWIGRLRIF